MVMVMIIIVVVRVVMMYIRGVQSLCWSRSLTCILKMTDFSVGDNRPSSCLVYTIYQLLP